MTARRRQLLVGHFAVSPSSVIVCDRAFPVCAVLDRESGAVRRVAHWTVDESRRGRPVVTAVRFVGEDLWISSPAAGGVVRIAPAGELTIVPLPLPPGDISVLGGDVVVFADREWEADLGEELAERFPAVEHPVEWRERPPSSTSSDGWFMMSPGLNVLIGPEPHPIFAGDDVDDNDDDDDDDDDDDGDRHRIEERSRPVWRIVDGVPTPLELDGDGGPAFSLADGRMLVVLRRSSDPVIKTRERGSGVSYEYPQSVVIVDPSGATTSLVEAKHVCIVEDGSRYWVAQQEPTVEGDSTSAYFDASTDRLVPSDEWPDEIELEPLDDDEFGREVVVAGSERWFVTEGRTGLTCTVGSDRRREVTVDIDLSGRVADVVPPAGLDVAAFETGHADSLRDELGAGWVDSEGEVSPFVEGATFQSVTVRGEFPASHLALVFSIDDRPNRTFGLRFALFDELGNPHDLEYAGVYVMETIHTAMHLFPGVESADADGIVWMDL